MRITHSLVAASLLSTLLTQVAAANEDTTGKVTIAVEPSQQETLPGENITFTIDVRNFDRHTQHDLDVSFLFDHESLSVIETLPQSGTFAREGIALWHIDELFAGQTWSVQFPVHVENTINTGHSTEVITRVSGSEVNIENSTITDAVTIGAAVLPPTGGRTDLLASIVLMGGTLLLLIAQRRFATR